MVKLTIDNSISSITGLNAFQEKKLRSLLSYPVDATKVHWKALYGGYRRYLMDKKGCFGTGLKSRVKQWLKAEEIDFEIVDKRIRPELNKLDLRATFPFTPRKEQQDASDACVKCRRGIIVAPTGSGKSLIIAMIVNQLKVNTLIVVPSVELKHQLTDYLKDIFGNLLDIDVENVDALADKPMKKKYDCVIIDEFHRSASKTYQKLNKTCWNGIYYKFGLTATPFRAHEEENLLLESVIASVIYRLHYVDAVDKGYIVPAQAFYIDIPKIPYTDSIATYSKAYSKLIVQNKVRNSTLTDLLVKLHVNKFVTLCLVKEIEHGEILSKEGAFTFVQGNNEDNTEIIRGYNAGNIRTIVATYGTMGEGIDTKACEYVIIATPMKSKNLFMQCIGRAFRNYPGKTQATIILLKDTSHKWFRQAFNTQCKILLDEYGIIPAKLDIT